MNKEDSRAEGAETTAPAEQSAWPGSRSAESGTYYALLNHTPARHIRDHASFYGIDDPDGYIREHQIPG